MTLRASALLALSMLLSSVVHALPMYAQRSGRTCGNCHISPTYEDPNGWDNPELSKRKCNMSCMSCHVNPSGGGMRNTPGRYYGQSTLSIVPTQERSYSDYVRELLPETWIRFAQRRLAWEAEVHPSGRTIPSSWREVTSEIGTGRRGGFTAYGKPLGEPNELAMWDGRYRDLNADPLFQFGVDLRLAYWSENETVFPMQYDVSAAVHPIEHLTLVGTAAARGRAGGFVAVAEQDRSVVFARNAFLMVHELPYVTYAKAGIFLPNFGTHLDDHTTFTRELVELDVSTSDSTVIGVELGAAPNYPHVSVSAFRNLRPAGAPNSDPGWGLTANAGWRDLGWSLSVHGMLKRRGLAARGDLDAVAVSWGLTPFYLSNSLPVTYMGELLIGRAQESITGMRRAVVASYHELWVVIVNGISLRAKLDQGTRDRDAADDNRRYSVALDISPFPGLTFIVQGRYLQLDEGPNALDAFIQTHLWF